MKAPAAHLSPEPSHRALPTPSPLLPLPLSPPAVRNRAMEVLGKCHAQLGPALTDFLEGLKPAQLMALEEYFRQNPKAQVGGRAAQVCCTWV